jgi:hypothetical protein
MRLLSAASGKFRFAQQEQRKELPWPASVDALTLDRPCDHAN